MACAYWRLKLAANTFQVKHASFAKTYTRSCFAAMASPRDDLLKSVYVHYDEESGALQVTKWHHSATFHSHQLLFPPPCVFLASNLPGVTSEDKVRTWQASHYFQEYAHLGIVTDDSQAEQENGYISGDYSD